jgi:ERCC4-type nuclease
MQAFWILKKTGNPKFPYRVTVVKSGEAVLDLYVQDKWPGTKGNIFCLSATEREPYCGEEELERVGVVNYQVYGKRVTIILDRPIRKRCNFLFLTKPYKNKPGEYEQIFWQTQQGLEQRKTKYKLSYNKSSALQVFIDTQERYAWNFPGLDSIKEKLPIGDYAIKDDFGVLAVVERKTLNNLKAEFNNLKKFHQHLSELEAYRYSALVVEAAYTDFLNPDKAAPYQPGFTAKALAEIQVDHPNLSIIFAGSRKAAVVWAQNFFRTCLSKRRDNAPEKLKDSSAKYGTSHIADAPMDEIRRIVFQEMPEHFTTTQLKNCAPAHRQADVRRVLEQLKAEGRLQSDKQGRNLLWRKTGQ